MQTSYDKNTAICLGQLQVSRVVGNDDSDCVSPVVVQCQLGNRDRGYLVGYSRVSLFAENSFCVENRYVKSNIR